MAEQRPSIEPYVALITAKCREVQRQNIGIIDTDDLVQEVALWWYGQARPDQLEELLDTSRDPKRMRLRRTVWRVADRAARKAKAWRGPDHAFIAPRYGGREVLELIPVAMEPGALPDGGGIKDGPRAHKNLAEGGDTLAALIDVRRALHKTSADDLAYLHRLRSVRWNYELIAAVDEVEVDSVRRRTARIATRMADWLNDDDTPEEAAA